MKTDHKYLIKMSKILKNILLFFVAIFLLSTIGVYGLIYAFVYSIFNIKKSSFGEYWGNLLYQINVGIDMIGNVMLGKFLNHHAIQDKTIYPFGNVNYTISHVLAVNKLKHDNTTRFGDWIIDILERIDPGHMEISL